MRIPWDGGKRVALSPHPNNAVSTNSTDNQVIANRLDSDEKRGTAQRLDEDEVSRTYLTDSLGRKQSTAVAERLEDDERAKSDLGRQGSGWVINESGLYNVILRSDKLKSIWAAVLFKWFNFILNFIELIYCQQAKQVIE